MPVLIIWICTVAVAASSVYGACEPGWVQFQESCYTLVTAFRQWADAKKFCENMNNTHLVIVMSEEENEFLKAVLRTRHAIPVPSTHVGVLITFSDSSSFNMTELYFKAPEIQFWMDGVDQKTEGDWIWERTGERFEVSDWFPGEPNQSNGEEDCLTFYTRYDMRWNDEHCDRLFPFLCERESVNSGILG